MVLDDKKQPEKGDATVMKLAEEALNLASTGNPSQQVIANSGNYAKERALIQNKDSKVGNIYTDTLSGEKESKSEIQTPWYSNVYVIQLLIKLFDVVMWICVQKVGGVLSAALEAVGWKNDNESSKLKESSEPEPGPNVLNTGNWSGVSSVQNMNSSVNDIHLVTSKRSSGKEEKQE